MSADQPLLPLAHWVGELRDRPALGWRVGRYVAAGAVVRVAAVVLMAALGIAPQHGAIAVMGIAPVVLVVVGRITAANAQDADARDAAVAWSWLEAAVAGVTAHVAVVLVMLVGLIGVPFR